jgi:dissimilatory sulfite reductase (desulfoviridin) alpha/beta subunit
MPTDHHIEDRENKVAVDIAVEGKTGPLDFNTLKTGGIIKQRQKGLFTVRLKCPGGRVPLEKLAKIVEVARKYAGDYVHISVRQSIELPYVSFENFGRIKQELAEVGQEIASCGPRVRVPTACSGCEYNPNGLTNTQDMAAEVCRRFFAKQPLPHKFKISFSGCPIDCARTNEMDLGFQGAVKPAWDRDSCIGCGICARACLEGAITSEPDSGFPVFHPEKCLFCGDCIRACPTESWKAETTGWIVRCGGKHGRHPINGQVVGRFVSDERIPLIVEAVLSWYEKNGRDKGRVRLGTLLLDEKLWTDFLEAIQPALGVYAVPNSSPPLRNEIHFAAR